MTLSHLAGRLKYSIRQTKRLLKEEKDRNQYVYGKDIFKRHQLEHLRNCCRPNYSSIRHFYYMFKQYYGISANSLKKREENHIT